MKSSKLEQLQPLNKSLVNRLFYILLVLHIIPLFFSKYFPTQDGPSHLKNAWMLKDMILDPNSVFHKFFTINTVPNPNWSVHFFYTVLLTFLPAFAAEKILLMLYIVFLPLSFRYLIRQINPGNEFISLLIFPFVYNITFYYGFFNFCTSIIFCFYTIGFWIRHSGLFSFKQLILFALLILLTYFSHPISFVTGALILGFLWAGYSWAEVRTGVTKMTSISGRLFYLVLGYLPSLLFFFKYLKKNNEEINWPEYNLITYIKEQLINSSISYTRNLDLFPYVMLTAILGIMMIYSLVRINKTKNKNRLNVLFLLWFVFAILIYFSPDDYAGGSFIFMRLALYSNMLAILAVAAGTYSEIWTKISAAGFFLFAFMFLGIRSYSFYKASKGLDEYLSIEKYIPEGKTFLPFTVNNVHRMPDGSKRIGDIEIYLHASGYISIDRNALSLENYEATYDYFPLQWKNNCNAGSCFPEGGDTLKDSLISVFQKSCGIAPDYIFLWGEPDTIASKKFLLSEIEKHYVLDHLSDHKYGRLYIRK